MKKSIYKYISIAMCSIILSFTILTSSLNVKSYADLSPSLVNSFNSSAADIISSVVGYVWHHSTDIGHEFLQFLGLEDEPEPVSSII